MSIGSSKVLRLEPIERSAAAIGGVLSLRRDALFAGLKFKANTFGASEVASLDVSRRSQGRQMRARVGISKPAREENGFPRTSWPVPGEVVFVDLGQV
jgi:hypothetical protein